MKKSNLFPPAHLSLSKAETNRIIEMAWDDKTPFEAIKVNFNCSEKDVIELMKMNLKKGSYETWRKRVTGRKAKHSKKLQCYA